MVEAFFAFNGMHSADKYGVEITTSASTSSDIAVLPEPTVRDRLECFHIPQCGGISQSAGPALVALS